MSLKFLRNQFIEELGICVRLQQFVCDKCSTKCRNGLNFITPSNIFENKGNIKVVLNESETEQFKFVLNNTLSTIFNTFHDLMNDLFKRLV